MVNVLIYQSVMEMRMFGMFDINHAGKNKELLDKTQSSFYLRKHIFYIALLP